MLKKPPAYNEKQIEKLESKDLKIKKEKNKKEILLLSAFKYIISNEQMRCLSLVILLFVFSTGYTGKYQTVIEAAITKEIITVQDSNTILTFYPLINGIFMILSGFMIDKLGRKKSSLILTFSAIIGFLLFFLGCTVGLNPYLIGFWLWLFLSWPVFGGRYALLYNQF